MHHELAGKFQKIKTLIFDVDGVFTDCSLHVSETEVARIYNVRDGYAVSIAAKAGYRMAVITGGRQQSIATRLRGLGIQEVFLSVGTDQKLATLDMFVQNNGLAYEEVLYIGDDIPDWLLMRARPVLSACPADAVEEVKALAHYISPYKGGQGAVRDVIEQIMKAQGTWLTVF